MADRYWVGGAGFWNGTNTTNWSTTSGGSGGASVPTSLDNVIIDTGTGTITIRTSGGASYNALCFSLSISNGRDIDYVSTSSLSVGDPSGGATNSGNMSVGTGSDVSVFNLEVYACTTGATSSLTGTGTLSLAASVFLQQGKLSSSSLISGVFRNMVVQGGTFVILDDLSFNTFDVYSGATLDFNNTARSLDIYNRWNIESGSSWVNTSGGLTLTLQNANFTDLVGHTYASVTFNRGSGVPANVTGSNVFNTLTITLYGIKVRGGDTITVGTLNTSGALSGAVLSNSSGNTQFNLSKFSGFATVSKMTISNCNFTGGATWTADNTSVDAGNNSGIQFANTPSFLAFLL